MANGEQNIGDGSAGVRDSGKAATSSIIALVQQFESATEGSKKAKDAITLLTKEHTTLGKEMTKETKESAALIASMKILQKTGNAAAVSTNALGQHLAKTHKMISEAQVSKAEKTREALETELKRELGAAQQNKGKIAGINKELREISEESAEAILARDVEAARAQSQFGKGAGSKLSGGFKFMEARAGQAGLKVGKVGGAIFGKSAAAIATLAKFAGVAMLAFTAFRFVMGQVAGRARLASKAGLELGDTFMSASNAGAGLRRTADAFTATHMGAISSAKLMELQAGAQEDYINGVVATGQSYRDAMAGTAANRNDLKNSTIEFVGTTALMADVLGTTSEEAVKMGTAISRVARTDMTETQKSMIFLSDAARSMLMPMTALSDVFMDLAVQSDTLGTTDAKLRKDTMAYIGAVQHLGKEEVPGFADSSPDKMGRQIKALVSAVGAISSLRAGALTMTPGQSFEDTLGKAFAFGGGQDKRKTVGDMVRRLVGKTEGLSMKEKLFVTQAMGLGTGDVKDDIMLGSMLASLSGAGGSSMKEIEATRAAALQDRLDASKSVGQQVAAGADVFQVMANYLSSITNMMVDFFTSAWWGDNKAAKQQQQEAIRLEGLKNKEAAGGRRAEFGYRPTKPTKAM